LPGRAVRLSWGHDEASARDVSRRDPRSLAPFQPFA